MTTFNNLTKAVISKAKKDLAKFKRELKAETKESILNGDYSHYYRRYMTATVKRDAKTMTKTVLINKIVSKYVRDHEKSLNKQLQRIETIAAAKDVESVTINLDWKKSRTWGNNAKAEIRVSYSDNTCEYFESSRTSGCGYDKESTAISEALNQCNGVLKLLYKQKNKLKNFKQSNSSTIGYGAGYGILPQLEGGVGVSCMYKICESIGMQFESISHGRTFDVYQIKKK
jgi:hypothetical protein